jgi:transposase
VVAACSWFEISEPWVAPSMTRCAVGRKVARWFEFAEWVGSLRLPAVRTANGSDAEIYLIQPGLGVVLGAWVLAEFGDDTTRYPDARARKNYAGTSPITRQSGKKTVLARGIGHRAALRQLGYRLVGVPHGCLKTGTSYRETTAWAHHQQDLPTAC